MVVLYLVSAGAVLIIAAIVMVYFLSRVVDLLERIAAVAERMETRDREREKEGP